MEEKIKNNKKKLIISAIIIGVLLIVLFLFSTIFAIFNFNSTKMISGVKLNNIDISKLTKEEATEKINNITKEKKEGSIKLKKDEFESEVLLNNIEVNYDVENAVNEAYKIGRNSNIFVNNFQIIKTKIKNNNIEMENSYNEESLDEIINDLNSKIPGAIKNSSYYIDESNLIITKGEKGNSINRENLKQKISDNLKDITLKEEEIEFEVEEKDPDPIDIEKIYNEIHTEAKDAYYTKDPFEVHPHVNGVDFAISMDEAKKIIEEEKTEYTIPLKITVPNITTDKIGNEAFPDLLGSFTTKYDASNTSRTTNLRLAGNKINGTVVMPGQTFSYNAIVGERTIAAGYKEAKVYQNGKVVDGLGGGICQISSTLYNAAVFANLEIVARRNHQFVPSYVGPGRDATVVYGSTDFKFKNTRTYPVRIKCSVSGGVAKVDIYGMKEETEYKIEIQTVTNSTIETPTTYIDDPNLEQGVEKVEQKGHGGYRTTTYKITYLNGSVVSKKVLSNDTYNAMETIIRRGVSVPVVVETPAATTEPIQVPESQQEVTEPEQTTSEEPTL